MKLRQELMQLEEELASIPMSSWPMEEFHKLMCFDVIIGMDWLAKYYAVIVCDEKIVRIPYGDEVFIIERNGCNSRNKSKLSIISCIKTQKYIQKGCQFYLAQVTAKKTDDKSEEKRLEDVPIIQDFLKVFPEDLP
ncbi:hypothetical protein Tco_0062544 [Tanacetum coccineum]